MSQLASEDLRSINKKLTEILRHFQSSSNVSPEALAADFQDLQESVMQAADVIRHAAMQTDPALDGELLGYGELLEAFQQWLPSIQLKLEMEKIRLEKTFEHLQVASAWAVASKGILR